MSQLPQGWDSIQLKDLFSFVLGGDWGKDPEYIDEDYKTVFCIRGTEFKRWSKEKGSTSVERKVKNSSAEKRELKPGDILIEISGGGPEQPVGRTVLIDDAALNHNPDYPKVCTNFIRLTRPKDSVDSRYLNYYLQCFYASGEVVNYQGGSNNLRNLKFKEYETIKVPLAPFEEQKRIADKLDSVLAKVEAAQARLDKIPGILKRFRQSVLAAATSGELTKDWREDNDLMSNYEENIDWTVLDGGVAPHYIPSNWTWHHVGNLIEIHNSKRKPLKQADRDKRSGDYPYYGAFGIIDDIDDFLFDGSYLLLAEDGKNLESRQRPISLIANGKFWVNNHAHVIQGKESVTIEYLMHFFNSPTIEIDQFLTGMDQVKLNKSSMIKIPIPLPPYEEQTEVNRRVEELFSNAATVEKQYNAAKARLDKLTQSILAKAFKGQLL